LWEGDPSLWTEDAGGQAEIRKRLGWLRLPIGSQARLPSIQSLAGDIARSGIDRFLLLGMGGSSLAPEVMSLVFQDPDEGTGGMRATFAVLDSTDPAQVRQAGQDFPPAESLYLVSSKSGGTAEVNAMLEHFWQISGADGSRFVAITDPGTSLESLSTLRKFCATRLADPAVGGRFSVLADYGLLPMALMGYDVRKFLECAAAMMNECRAEVPATRNPGLVLGAILGEAALAGRDKLTILADPQCAAFGSWLEQLIAESSGKQGRGIVVVDGEPLMPASSYRDDRLFVYFRVDGRHASQAADLLAAGQPVLEFPVADATSLVAEFYRWEAATAIACHILGVNAFDQPDVQDNKERTRIKIDAYRKGLSLDTAEALVASRDGRGYSNQDLRGSDLADLLEAFLGLARQGDYIAINAYLPRNASMQHALTDLRTKILVRTGCATTLGFGPRFLHSTGQLHKGGPASGLFLQITADPIEDIEIPASGAETGKRLTFGALERAQALGDYEALQARGRRILRLHFPTWQAVSAWIEPLSGTNG
jgi:transaldolase/glucose-6-phosphate isomerase